MMLRALENGLRVLPPLDLHLAGCFVRGYAAKGAKPATKKPSTGTSGFTQKTQKKSAKKKGSSDGLSPMMAKTLRMLVPEEVVYEPPVLSEEELVDQARLEREHNKYCWQKNIARQKDLYDKLQLKLDALNKLPKRLRKAALEEDMLPPPLARNIYFQFPPEAYRDSSP